jgi:hypothetical protein
VLIIDCLKTRNIRNLMMKYKIIKSKKWQVYNSALKLPLPICKLHSSDKNPYIEYQDVFGTSKPVLKKENRVTIISN